MILSENYSLEDYISTKQYNEAIEVSKNIIQVCLRIPDYNLLKKYYSIGGKLWFKVQRYQEAIRFYEPLRNLCRTNNDHLTLMNSLLRIGQAFQALKMYDKGIFAFKKLLQFSWKYENYEYEIKAYDNLWMQYYFKSDIERCRFYHNRAAMGKCEEK